ncbi:HAD-IA family hydrolase [Aliidiomarina halalkaliphila]|uniref:HAD-IA family hydrolase n=2 Tax=Aliidiomarina halalkaliphila TaxID=2593535 RepID=A0A552X4C7_9GAMM|nr:HAD-IA family hydrolase [Aliidiomarina halalkaliphila]
MDSVPRIVSCMQKMAQQTGLPVPAESAVKDIIGLSLWVALERLFDCYDPDEQQRLIAVYRELYVHTDATPSPMFPSAHEVLAELHGQGYQLAVATGKARQGLERAWRETNTGQFFSASRCADEAMSKPHPQMLNDILVGTGTLPQQAVMIGDSQFDLQMANNAGVASAGVAWGVHDATRLQQEAPLTVFSQLQQLPTWLADINNGRLGQLKPVASE